MVIALPQPLAPCVIVSGCLAPSEPQDLHVKNENELLPGVVARI